MICDGYTEYGSCHLGQYAFRPLTERQRYVIRSSVSEARVMVARSLVRAAIVIADWNVEDPLLPLPETVVRTVIGTDLAAKQAADADNLSRGVALLAKYPHLSDVTCDYCRRYWFDPSTGDTATEPNGALVERPESAVVACETDTGCPIGHWSNPSSLSDKNRMALENYAEKLASGESGDDIERFNAAIIRHAMEGR